MDISQADSVSGATPQSNVPQAPILVRPTEASGQSVDGLLPATPLTPVDIPLSLTNAPATQPVGPTAMQPDTAAPSPAPTPVSPPMPPAAVLLDAPRPVPSVPGGVAPSTVNINEVFETPPEAKAQIVSQVPPVAEPVPESVVVKHTKTSLPVMIGLIAGGVILLAGVAYITFSMVSKKPAASVASTATVTQPVVMKSSDITGLVAKTVAGSSTAQGLSGPVYQVTKATYGVSIPADAAISYPAADTATATSIYGKILPVLTANGLQQRSGATISATSGVFDASGTHCQVVAAASLLTLACSNTTSYQAATTKLAPLYTVFTAARPVDKTKQPQTLAITRWSASKTTGYTIATISITDVTVGAAPVAHLFYQTPDASWHYVGEALSTTGCGNFNTTDLKKAFLGEPCLNGTTSATVVLQ